MKTNIGIPDEHLHAVALELNKLLVDEFILFTKTRNYHWNVEGANFMEMHKLYESQFEALDEIMDDVAERVRSLGRYSEGRLKDFITPTRVEEPMHTSDQGEQLQNLLADHEPVIQNIRNQHKLS
jgi:starvation-inducible DNA-binding protein